MWCIQLCSVVLRLRLACIALWHCLSGKNCVLMGVGHIHLATCGDELLSQRSVQDYVSGRGLSSRLQQLAPRQRHCPALHLTTTHMHARYACTSQWLLTGGVPGEERTADAAKKALQDFDERCDIHATALPATSTTGERDVLSAAVHTASTVVLCNVPRELHALACAMCRELHKPVVSAAAHGLWGRLAVDAGAEFLVEDARAAPGISTAIFSLHVEGSIVRVQVTKESPHGLDEQDTVILARARAADGAPCPSIHGTVCMVHDLHSFSMQLDGADAEQHAKLLAPGVAGGHVQPQARAVQVSHAPLSTLLSPDEPLLRAVQMADASYDRWLPVLHFGWDQLGSPLALGSPCCVDKACSSTLQAYVECVYARIRRASGRRPRDCCTSPTWLPAGEVLPHAISELLDTEEPLSPASNELHVLLAMAMSWSAACTPWDTVVGSFAAQEAIKLLTHRFQPLNQVMYLHAAHVLPALSAMRSVEPEPEWPSRLARALPLLGAPACAALHSLRAFLVGMGAIGCEYLKCMAGLGVCTGSDALLSITDPDSVELSNLSRQLLFRASDVGTNKAIAAAHSLRKYGAGLQVQAFTDKVGSSTERVFNAEFWSGQHVCLTALDNVAARLYLDSTCISFELPMIDSGTLGPAGHVQVITPRQTEHYGAAVDPPERAIPVCTLRSFPSRIEHTLQWARDWLHSEFTDLPAALAAIVARPDSAPATLPADIAARAARALRHGQPRTPQLALQEARYQYELAFVASTRALLSTYPPNLRTAEGMLFWSGEKRCPTPLQFCGTDAMCQTFMRSTASMYLQQCGQPVPPEWATPESFAALLASLQQPHIDSDTVHVEREPDKANPVQPKPAALAPAAPDLVTQLQELGAAAAAAAPDTTPAWRPLHWDKDVDAHMAIVWSCSNLRARVYGIPEVDFEGARNIAGRIVPAIATTTAAVVGAAILELALVLQEAPAAMCRNTYCNLALPLLAQSEPGPADMHSIVLPPEADPLSLAWSGSATQRADGSWLMSWTVWDAVQLDFTSTILSILETVEAATGLTVTLIAAGTCQLYSDMSASASTRALPALERLAAIDPARAAAAGALGIVKLSLLAEDDSGDEMALMPVWLVQLGE